MLREKNQISDLKVAILDLKKEVATLKEINQTLKVKNRKQQTEISKKDKQIEALLDPRKSHLMKKVLSEKGASIVLNQQAKNNKLEKALTEKDSLINRLRNDLQTIKLYGSRGTSKKRNVQKFNVETKLDINVSNSRLSQEFEEYNTVRSTKSQNTSLFKFPCLENDKETILICDTPHSVELSPVPSIVSTTISETNLHNETPIEDIPKNAFDDFSRKELISLIDDLKNNQTVEVHQIERPQIQKLGPQSPNSDLQRNELYSETPHREIQQLQDYFLDMLTEVEQLKTTISELKLEQINTANILKQKDSSSVGQLTDEIKKFKKSQSPLKTVTIGRRKMRSGSKLVTSKVNVYDYTKSDKKIINEQSKKSDKSKKIIKIPISANTGLHSAEEEEQRRDTYNGLMEQMLQSTIRLRQLTQGDNIKN